MRVTPVVPSEWSEQARATEPRREPISAPSSVTHGVIVALRDVSPGHLDACAELCLLVESRLGHVPLSLVAAPRPAAGGRWDDASRAWLASRVDGGDELVLSVDRSPGRVPAEAVPHELAAFELMGFAPHGFMIPTHRVGDDMEAALRRAAVRWWATPWRLHTIDGRDVALPSAGLSPRGGVGRIASRVRSRVLIDATWNARAIRLDLHPADLDSPARRWTAMDLLEQLLEQRRHVVTHADVIA